MREDMAKVIVTRPRVGGGWSRERKIPAPEEQPIRESMRARWTSRKHLNETLAPLRRYLRKQIGRPWNAVYAEICANLSVTSAVQQHVRDHLDDFVGRNAFERNGALYVMSGRFDIVRRLSDGWVEMFVCPHAGTLQENPYWAARRGCLVDRRAKRAAGAAERAKRLVVVSPYVQLHRLAGQWYEVRLARIRGEAERAYDDFWDAHADRYAYAQREARVEDVIIASGAWSGSRRALYGRSGVRGVAKRQLSRKELKRYGLRGTA